MSHVKLIPLTQGLFTLVDAADFERLNAFKWCASTHDGKSYAVRGVGAAGSSAVRLTVAASNASDEALS